MCLGGSSEPAFLGGALGGAKRRVGRVRLRRGRDVDHRLGNRELAFGTAEKIVGVLGRIGDDQRLRIGKPDIFDRHPHDAAREVERVLAGVEHARQIIERRVRIGAAHRLVQGRDQVVVAVLRLVVDRCAPLHDLLQLAPRRTFRLARRRARLPRRASSAARPSPSAMRISEARASGSSGKALPSIASARASSFSSAAHRAT